MIHQTLLLDKKRQVTMTTYVIEQSTQSLFQMEKRPSILILPGGAYAYLSDTEAEAVALTFLKEGFNTFVLNYSVLDQCTYPEILEEISLAILTIRNKAELWHGDPDAVIVMGFSAGACLGAMSATQWNTSGLAERLNTAAEKIRPDAVVMGYGAWDNSNTIQKDPKYYNPKCAKIAKDCTPQLDFINYMGEHMPPMFIWHNRYDRYVPACNPVMAAAKLLEYDIPFELHLFQGGEHGMSVANNLSCYQGKKRKAVDENPSVALWVELCVNWLNNLFHCGMIR